MFKSVWCTKFVFVFQTLFSFLFVWDYPNNGSSNTHIDKNREGKNLINQGAIEHIHHKLRRRSTTKQSEERHNLEKEIQDKVFHSIRR